ncbi:MAG: toll/interleukin-1 receptor domain-containing protein [Clostridiales bacterium]|nr:toll/interleukin-1 receptor domain-containing protein [Clostridiales bacterium]
MLTDREKSKLDEIKERYANGGEWLFSVVDYQKYHTVLDKLVRGHVLVNGGQTLDGTYHYIQVGSLDVFLDEELAEEQEQYYMESGRRPRGKEYDVFISHANKDKSEYVDSLYDTINKLGVNIFYDKKSLSWGDEWKKVLLNGTEKSEFSIIVISQNFFGREWTERELEEFLKRQNASGQKIVLPLIHNISIEELKEKYPKLGEIQAISTNDYSQEEVALLFAGELIKRLKS